MTMCVSVCVCVKAIGPRVENKKDYSQNLFSPGQDIASIWHFSVICFQSSHIAKEQLWFSASS